MEIRSKVTEPIVPLTDNESGPAFYCVHALSGVASGYSELASLVGPDIRFYGVQVPSKLRTPEFPVSIEAMAQHYVEALNKIQPEGPIMLGGWSVGATVALEMSQQLMAGGRKVSLLAAIDKAPENIKAGLSPQNPLYLAKLLANFPDWMIRTSQDQAARQALVRRVQAFGHIGLTGAQAEDKTARHPIENFINAAAYKPSHLEFMKAFYNAAFRYKAEAYPGPVVVYEAKTTPPHRLTQVGAIWKKLAPQAQVVRLHGNHMSIVVEPDSLALANDLRQKIVGAALEGGENSSPSSIIQPVRHSLGNWTEKFFSNRRHLLGKNHK